MEQDGGVSDPIYRWVQGAMKARGGRPFKIIDQVTLNDGFGHMDRYHIEYLDGQEPLQESVLKDIVHIAARVENDGH